MEEEQDDAVVEDGMIIWNGTFALESFVSTYFNPPMRNSPCRCVIFMSVTFGGNPSSPSLSSLASGGGGGTI
eukprot:11202060-Ditylum_brightwellii.AAC.1